MFDYLRMTCKDSDYTVVIAIMHLSSPYNFGGETHLGAGDTSAFVSPWPPLLERFVRQPVAVLFLGKAHEDSDQTAVIAVVH